MIYTSYFAKMRKMSPEQQAKCVSIARFTPKGINIKGYPHIAPRKEILEYYKKTHDEDWFFNHYMDQLECLDPHAVARELDGRILCCFEKSTDFCHRHVFAEWLREHGIECEELEI